jgi:multicomponent K+:H+ antiporter subunit D
MAGLPPLAGFFGKALLLAAAGQTAFALAATALVLGSSLAMMVALARAGSTLFWKQATAAEQAAGAAAAVQARHAAAHKLALAGLLAAVLASAAAAGPLGAYTQAAADQLIARTPYVDAVLGARPVPPAWDVRKEMRERGELK